MNEQEMRDLQAVLGGICKGITHPHDGACYVSTEVVLMDGTTLELGVRETDDACGLELIIEHHKDRTFSGFLKYKEECEARFAKINPNYGKKLYA